MKGYLEARKEELKKRGYKGFTLMEMLIVVAIIAILIAIAIPVFTSQLNSARVAADEANIRSGYATASATVLTTNNITSGTSWTLNSDGTLKSGTGGSFRTTGAPTAAVSIAGQSIDAWSANQPVTYTWDGSKVKIKVGN